MNSPYLDISAQLILDMILRTQKDRLSFTYPDPEEGKWEEVITVESGRLPETAKVRAVGVDQGIIRLFLDGTEFSKGPVPTPEFHSQWRRLP